VSIEWESPLASILGDRSAKAVTSAFGYLTVGELLEHYPRRYATRGELTSIAGIPLGETATLVAEVVSVTQRTMRAKRGSVLEVVITDGTGLVTLTFFNQAWRAKDLHPGVRGIFAGKVGLYRGERQLAHPDYELFDDVEGQDQDGEAWAKKPIPLYPASAKIASWQIAKAVGVILDVLTEVPDPVPSDIQATEKLLELSHALSLIHRPAQEADWQKAQATLRFHEAFVLQCALVQRRARAAEALSQIRTPGALSTALMASLPFELTADQNEVAKQIREDLASGHPMNRLVQGEVGSGKTIVALQAMVTVAESGGQTALLAPTEVLAWQHFRSIGATLGPELVKALQPVLLTGVMPAADKKRALLAAASGSSRIVIGTHAIFSDRVQFADLGLVVVDEQHRFGVDQREALRQKGTNPHVLVLTATPIPRTVAMTVFGDLDISTIRNLPQGRQPIATHVVALADTPGWYQRVWQRLAEEVRAGRQGFVVAPAISAQVVEEDEDGESLDDDDGAPRPLSTVLDMLPLLRSMECFEGMRLEAMHGRMSPEEKDTIMRAFTGGEIDILVTTTVIEVGIDVHNATAMVILDADRFGVSQLHQLRGRVGRGQHAGVCLLVTHCLAKSPARARVDAVAGTLDGFVLANIDVELRSEGDVLGQRQSGRRSSLKLVRVTTDGDLIETARVYANKIVSVDPELAKHPAVAAGIRRRLDDTLAKYLDKN